MIENCSKLTWVKEHNKCQNLNWYQIPYYNETVLPVGIDPKAGSWSLYYFKRDNCGKFYDLENKRVDLSIKDPKDIDFENELKEVMRVQECLINQCNQKNKDIALFWGKGVPVNQWTPIALELITSYKVTPPDAGRILSSISGAINDAFVITWYYKYLYCMPRPCQLYHNLKTILNTPRFPSYPSGHSVISGACEKLLSYYFPNEAEKLNALANDASMSRLYGGIHFESDLSEGLSLGRKIGESIINVLKNQNDCESKPVDTIYYKCINICNILPPYYPCE